MKTFLTLYRQAASNLQTELYCHDSSRLLVRKQLPCLHLQRVTHSTLTKTHRFRTRARLTSTSQIWISSHDSPAPRRANLPYEQVTCSICLPSGGTTYEVFREAVVCPFGSTEKFVSETPRQDEACTYVCMRACVLSFLTPWGLPSSFSTVI